MFPGEAALKVGAKLATLAAKIPDLEDRATRRLSEQRQTVAELQRQFQIDSKAAADAHEEAERAGAEASQL